MLLNCLHTPKTPPKLYFEEREGQGNAWESQLSPEVPWWSWN